MSASVKARGGGFQTLRTCPPGLAVTALLCFSGFAHGQFLEQEPNFDKSHATIVSGLAQGQTIAGQVSSIADRDLLLVSTAPAAPGIYRHRLQLTPTTQGSAELTLRGMSQMNGVPAGGDVAAQFASSVVSMPRYVQWYGFGRSEQVYVRIGSGAPTPFAYTLTLESEAINPTYLGSLTLGQVTVITTGAPPFNDAEVQWFDSGFTPLTGALNDNGTGVSPRSRLTRSLPTGVLYLLVGGSNIATNQVSPPDDLNREGVLADFPDIVIGGSPVIGNDLSFDVAHQAGSVSWTGLTAERCEIRWFQFDIGGEASGACCAPDGSCALMAQAACMEAGGLYRGDGAPCESANCPLPPPTGACCLQDLSCMDLTEDQCVAVGGTYAGNGEICTIERCHPPPPTGACCDGAGGCEILTSGDCFIRGWSYFGDWTTCEDVCPPVSGACCLSRCDCAILTEAQCAAAGGRFDGPFFGCFDPQFGLCFPNVFCPCDWNGTDGLDSQDYFDFVNGFFFGDGDFNCVDGTDSQDFFDFINCFFGDNFGCGAGGGV